MLVQNSACIRFAKKQDFIWYRKISASIVYKYNDISQPFLSLSELLKRRLHEPGFLKLLWFACWYVCARASVCPLPRAVITSGMLWCDIGHVRLVKHVS